MLGPNAALERPRGRRRRACPVDPADTQPPATQDDDATPADGQPHAENEYDEENAHKPDGDESGSERAGEDDDEVDAALQAKDDVPDPVQATAAETRPTSLMTPPADTGDLTREETAVTVPPPGRVAAPKGTHVPGEGPFLMLEAGSPIPLEKHHYDLSTNNEDFADWLPALEDANKWHVVEDAAKEGMCPQSVLTALRDDINKWATSTIHERVIIKSSWMRVHYVFEVMTSDYPRNLSHVVDPTWFAPFTNGTGWTSTWRIAKVARACYVLAPHWSITDALISHAYDRAHDYDFDPSLLEPFTRCGTALLNAIRAAYRVGDLDTTLLPQPSYDPPLGTGATYWMQFRKYGFHLPRVECLLALDFLQPSPGEKLSSKVKFHIVKCALETLQVLELGPEILDCAPEDDKLTTDIMSAHVVWLRLSQALKMRGGQNRVLEVEMRKMRDFVAEGGLTAVEATTDVRWKVMLVHMKKSHKIACDVLGGPPSPPPTILPQPAGAKTAMQIESEAPTAVDDSESVAQPQLVLDTRPQPRSTTPVDDTVAEPLTAHPLQTRRTKPGYVEIGEDDDDQEEQMVDEEMPIVDEEMPDGDVDVEMVDEEDSTRPLRI
ncbi:hypothetical protein EXIGLDRAFT_784480, partial [Exidia glandulosa HHB12029]